MHKMFMTVVAAVSTAVLFAGNVCTWTGNAGDGKWATAGNWEGGVVPVSGNGDRVVLTNVVASAVISNNLGAITINGLMIAAGSQAFKLAGDSIELTSTSECDYWNDPKFKNPELVALYDATSAGEIEIATPLVLPQGTHRIRLASGGAIHISGDISGVGGLDFQSLSVAWQSCSWRETDRLKLSGNNTFEGSVNLRNYCTELATTNALGKAGKSVSCINHYAKYKLSAPGYYDYVFRVSDGEDWFYFMDEISVNKMEAYQTSCLAQLNLEGAFPVTFSNGLYATASSVTTNQRLEVSAPAGGSVHVYEKFRFGNVYVGDSNIQRENYTGGQLHLHCSTVDYVSFLLTQGGLHLYSPNVLNETDVPLYWYRRIDGVTCYYLHGADQTIDHLSTANLEAKFIADAGRFFQSDTPATLTLKATADGSANVSFKDALSVVYDAQGAYRQEITNRTITMTGDLVVSNGTFALVGTATMKDANLVRITSGGTFEIASSTAKSLENVRKILVENGGVLKLATAANPFGGTTEILVDAGGKVDAGSGATLTSALFKYDGVFVANARYQKTGGSDPTAEEVAWISGDAVLTVDCKDAYWKTAVDGTWGDSTKWVPATPAADNVVNLTAEGASYQVTVDADSGIAYKEIKAQHAAGGTATLEIAAPFETASPDVVFGAGSALNLATGGVWTWTPAPGGPWDTATHLTVKDGATFTVNGGTFSTSGFRGKFALGGADNSVTSTLAVTSGTFDFNAAATISAALLLNPGGRLAISGDGVAKFLGYAAVALSGQGGSIDVSENGQLWISGSSGTWFGGGDATFRGNAALQAKSTSDGSNSYMPRVYATPPAAGGTVEIAFRDHAYIGNAPGETKGDYFYRFTLGNGIADTTTKMTLDSDGVYNLGNTIEIGFCAGRGELRQSNGLLFASSSRGMAIGACDRDAETATPIDCSGLFEISGGTAVIQAGSWNEYDRLNGFTVGNGYYVKEGREGRFEGRAVISGGTVTNDGYRAVIGVGVGQAKGELIQTGGTHIKDGNAGDILIGFAGGEGLFAISNGTFYVYKNTDTWVGGCPTNDLERYMPYCPDRHDAKGVLDVAGGTFDSSGFAQLFVGVDGSGELAIGETGRLSVKNMAFSNAVDRAAGTETRLRYTFGPTGIGKATVTSDLRIDTGTKLLVDASGYTGVAKRFVVLDAANRTGDFAAEDITIIPPAGDRLKTRLTWQGNKLRIGLSEGLLMIVR